MEDDDFDGVDRDDDPDPCEAKVDELIDVIDRAREALPRWGWQLRLVTGYIGEKLRTENDKVTRAAWDECLVALLGARSGVERARAILAEALPEVAPNSEDVRDWAEGYIRDVEAKGQAGKG